MKTFTTKHNQKYHSIEAIERLTSRYIDKGGEVITLQEGCLGYGLTLLMGNNLKTAVITEHYINPWSSGNTVIFYNKLPKKYQLMLEEV